MLRALPESTVLKHKTYRNSGTVSSLNRALAAATCRAMNPELDDDLSSARCVACCGSKNER